MMDWVKIVWKCNFFFFLGEVVLIQQTQTVCLLSAGNLCRIGTLTRIKTFLRNRRVLSKHLNSSRLPEHSTALEPARELCNTWCRLPLQPPISDPPFCVSTGQAFQVQLYLAVEVVDVAVYKCLLHHGWTCVRLSFLCPTKAVLYMESFRLQKILESNCWPSSTKSTIKPCL